MPLYLVSTPIGNLADITLRALEVLAAADVVYAEDTRHTQRLFQAHGIETPLRSLHEHNEAGRIVEVMDRLRAGAAVALVSDAGTPLVSDPGYRLVDAASSSGVAVVPIPGASAVLAALVASGLPTDRFAFLGFVPRKGGDRQAALQRVAEAAQTVVLYESPHRLERLLASLEETCGPQRRVAVARELTKMHESIFRGSLSEARAAFAETRVRGEITVVVAADDTSTAVDEDRIQAFLHEAGSSGVAGTELVRELIDRFGLKKNEAYRRVHAGGDGGRNE